MSRSLSWFIGLRYLRSKRRNGFIGLVSVFALVAMMLGVFALIVVLSVMNGLDRELKERILKVIPHGFVTAPGGLEDWQTTANELEGLPKLVGVAPFTSTKGILTRDRAIRPVRVVGIDPQAESSVSEIGNAMIRGELSALRAGEFNVVLGSVIARSLGATLGDTVILTLPKVVVTPAGAFPRSRRFRVVGVFEAGAQVDQSHVFVPVDSVQRLLRLAAPVQGLRLRFSSIEEAPEGVSAAQARLGDGFEGRDWSTSQGSLFAAVKMEKRVVGVMLSVVIAIAAFNIVTSLIMMVAEKRANIAVLRTLGMRPWDIAKIFVVQGGAIGVSGIVMGAGLGIVVAHFLPELMGFLESIANAQIFDSSVYYVDYLPSEWRFSDTLITCGFALAVALLATLYPAYRAAQIAPAEALRYE